MRISVRKRTMQKHSLEGIYYICLFPVTYLKKRVYCSIGITRESYLGIYPEQWHSVAMLI